MRRSDFCICFEHSASQRNADGLQRLDRALHRAIGLFVLERAVCRAHLDAERHALHARQNRRAHIDVEQLDALQNVAYRFGDHLFDLEHRQVDVANKREVDVYSGKYHLFGEYFDLGFDKAAIIIAGRTESLLYSYYFAEPYRRAGYNVLVIDNRSHGKSDGRLNSLGYNEHRDILRWAQMLHDDLGNKQVYLHGICIGASNALFAMTADDCPDYMQGMTSEGMFTTFYESLYYHIKEAKQPVFPSMIEVRGYLKLFTGYDIKKDGPIFRIGKLKKPILMLQSKEDKYSLPHRAKDLYNKCPAPKRLAYFEKGRHSHIKINAPEKYDEIIVDFLREICENGTVTDTIVGE